MNETILLRQYGQAATIDGLFLATRDANEDRVTSAITFVATDCKVSIDGGAFVNTSATPTEPQPGSYRLTLTEAEMSGKRITIDLIDTPTRVWKDHRIIIETYGDDDAQHPTDFTGAARAINAAIIFANAADNTVLPTTATITRTCAVSWTIEFQNLPDTTSWEAIAFILKKDIETESDEAATLAIRVTNPADTDADGIVRFMGGEPGDTRTEGSISVDALNPGQITVSVNPIGSDIPPGDDYRWQLLAYFGDATEEYGAGEFIAARGVWRSVAQPNL